MSNSKQATSKCDHGYSSAMVDSPTACKELMARLHNACLLEVNDVQLEEIMLAEASRSWNLMDEALYKMVVASALQMLALKDQAVVERNKATLSQQLLNFAMVVLHVEEAMSRASFEEAKHEAEDAINDLTCFVNLCRFFYQRAPCSCFDAYRGQGSSRASVSSTDAIHY